MNELKNYTTIIRFHNKQATKTHKKNTHKEFLFFRY